MAACPTRMGAAVFVAGGSLLRRLVRMMFTAPDELLGRAAQRFYAVTERFLPPGQQPLIRNHADKRRFFAGVDDADATIAALRAVERDDEHAVLTRAARIATGEALVLGHGWLHVGAPPHWHREPIAGITAPQTHWSTIAYLDRRVVGDHKVLWEFNRHQYLVTLAQAWRYTRDSQWAALITSHLSSWIHANPVRRGVHWASSLEVAYRAISWCWTLRLVEDEKELRSIFDGEFSVLLLGSIQAHGRHVARYLSTWFSPNTHLTGEALALLYIGTCFPQLQEAEKWRTIGRNVLEREIMRQVHPDGVYFEQATLYQRYTAEIYLHFLLLCQRNGQQVDGRVETALHRMFDVLLAQVRADGTVPLLGDDDGGRLVQLDGSAPQDVRGLLAIAAVALDRPDLAWAGRGDDAALLWMLGREGVERRDALVGVAPSSMAAAFPIGGLYTIRDAWGASSGHATISCGPHGGLNGGHAHADALAVELFSSAGPLFVDSGTLAYDGPERNVFRTTQAHNTVEIAGESASRPGTAFNWESRADAVCDTWIHDAGMTWFQGHHDGYRRMGLGVRHTREIWHPISGCWVVEDYCADASGMPVVMRWHVAPGLDATIQKAWPGGATVLITKQQVLVASLLVDGPAGGVVDISPDRHSPQYGLEVPSTVLRWTGAGVRDFRIRSIVLDTGSFQSSGLVVRIAPEHSEQLLVSSGRPLSADDITSILTFDASHVDMHNDLSAIARMTLYVAPTPGTAERFIAVGASAVRIADRQIVSVPSANAWASAEYREDAWHCVYGLSSTGA